MRIPPSVAIGSAYAMQAVLVLVVTSLDTACPTWLCQKPVFLALFLSPLGLVVWAILQMRTWWGRVLTGVLVPLGSVGIMIVFGMLGVVLSLFVFGTFTLEGTQ